jgi:hypothetical protein
MAALIASLWMKQHVLTKGSLPSFEAYSQWILLTFGMLPSRRVIVEARMMLVDQCPRDEEDL